MARVTLETFYQEFKDNQNHLFESLDEIKKDIRVIHSKVNTHDIDIALVRSDVCNIIDCQKKDFNNNHSNRTFWISVVSISLAMLTFLLKLTDII